MQQESAQRKPVTSLDEELAALRCKVDLDAFDYVPVPRTPEDDE